MLNYIILKGYDMKKGSVGANLHKDRVLVEGLALLQENNEILRETNKLLREVIDKLHKINVNTS